MFAAFILWITLLGFAAPTKAQQARPVSDSVRLAYTDGRYAQTVSHLTDRRTDSLSGQAYYILGRSYQELHQHGRAIRSFESALEGGVEPSRGLPRLAASYTALGRLDRAKMLIKEAIAHTETARVARLRLQLSKIYEKQRKWQRAGEIYRRRLAADSANLSVRRRLAHVLVKQGQTAEAIPQYRRIYRGRPQDTRTAHALSRLLLETEAYTQTLHVTKKALTRDSTHAGLWRNRADAAFNLDSLALAERAYKRTLQHGDTSTTGLLRLGIVRVGRGKHHASLAPLRTAHRRDTTRAATHFYLGAALRGVGQPQKALTHFDRAAKYASEGILIDALTQAARTHDARNQLTEALHDYRTALRLRPDRADLYFRMATLYDSYYEDKSVAARYYRLFLQRSPAENTKLHAYAHRRLKQLRPVLHFQTDDHSP